MKWLGLTSNIIVCVTTSVFTPVVWIVKLMVVVVTNCVWIVPVTVKDPVTGWISLILIFELKTDIVDPDILGKFSFILKT